ncbi:MAG TPA: phosphoribosyltransferase family protein [Microthrixaceae bacterium]|nr:phosphoribosyltransferase family protein [Microthrixaceae bacterium]
MNSETAAPNMVMSQADDRQALLDVVKDRGLIQFDEPRELSSGELSRDFIDAKYALSRGSDLALACRVIADSVITDGIEFDAVGGMTMGADHFSHGIAMHLGGSVEWFVVRKAPKGRGTNQVVEGAKLNEASRVLLVDDIVTTGGSIVKAFDQVVATGATIVAGVTLVDRSDIAADFFASKSVPYLPVFTYRDLGIAPVGVQQ